MGLLCIIVTMIEIDLPRGCTIKHYSTLEAYTTRLFLPTNIDREAWEQKYKPYDQGARVAYESITRYFLMQGGQYPELVEPLADIDKETGLTNKVLLSQGVSSLGRGRFVLTTSNRLGMDATNKGALFALGEKMRFKGKMELRFETRSLEADVIGVVLNTGLRAARLKAGQSTSIEVDQIFSLFGAIISARKAFLREAANGDLSRFFTQEELDQSTNWVLFGDSSSSKNS